MRPFEHADALPQVPSRRDGQNEIPVIRISDTIVSYMTPVDEATLTRLERLSNLEREKARLEQGGGHARNEKQHKSGKLTAATAYLASFAVVGFVYSSPIVWNT